MAVLIEHLSWFGIKPICNGYIPHAIFIGNFCFPLCQRCTFIFIGIILGFIFVSKIRYKFMYLLFMLPMILDGMMSNIFKIDNGIFIRCATGLFFGIGISSLIVIIIDIIFETCLKKRT